MSPEMKEKSNVTRMKLYLRMARIPWIGYMCNVEGFREIGTTMKHIITTGKRQMQFMDRL